MVRRKLAKQIEEYTSKDLHRFWEEKFKVKHKSDYFVRSFIGKELSSLKSLLDNYDVFTIMLAMIVAIEEGSKDICFFAKDFKRFAPNSSHPDIDFFVKEYGSEKQRQLLMELRLEDSKWFPTSNDLIQKRSLEEILRNWYRGIVDETNSTRKLKSEESTTQ